MRAQPWLERRRKQSLMLLLSVGVGIAVSGCAQTVAGTADQICQQWRIVTVSRKQEVARIRLDPDGYDREVLLREPMGFGRVCRGNRSMTGRRCGMSHSG